MIKYKYWIFYLKNDIYDEYTIYAYTDDEKIANQFIRERNMKLFKVKKQDLTRDEVHSLSLEYGELYLELFNGETKSFVDGKMKTMDFDLVVTKQESVTMTNTSYDIMYAKIWTHTTYNPEIFTEKIRRSLTTLLYTSGYDAMYSYTKDNNLFKVYLYDDIKPDYLGAFIHYFGKTLKFIKNGDDNK